MVSVISACVLFISGALASTNSAHAEKNAAEKIKIQPRNGGIVAELVDQGDYYFHPNGRKIRYLRKKDVFALNMRGNNAEQIMAKMQSYYGDQIEAVKRHSLGTMMVVKVNPLSSKRGDPRKSRATINATTLKSLDRSISHVRPVFANANGQGDIVLLPKLTVKLKQELDDSALSKLLLRFGLQLDRKLRLSGNVYSLEIKNKYISEVQQFALVRSLMNHRWVQWAEPQFASKPYKTAFEPTSNPLYVEQWHLRNTGNSGSLCDSDCDANNAWDINADGIGGGDQGVGAVAGEGMVIAILDDGVQLDHEDLNIWMNPGEVAGNNVDDDGNGYQDDVNGWDFVNDPNTALQNSDLDGAGTCVGGDDGTPGPDNDPSPQALTNCFLGIDPVEQDDHGTAVAGLAAAIGTNSVGVVGTAFRAQILPIRLVSDFDDSNANSFCVNAAEAMAYAGRYADVINNSWVMNDVCIALEDTIADVVAGAVHGGSSTSVASNFKRPGLGSPVLFSSGNNASGWIKVTVPVSAGEHAYEWRFLRSPFPSVFDPSASYTLDEDNTAWIDDITWPDGTSEGFEADLSAFASGLVLNSCDVNCTSYLFPARPEWELETNADHVLSGSQSAKVDTSNSDCGNVYLQTTREESQAGMMSFWVWVSTNTQANSDKFEFLIDGTEVISFGDIGQFVDNAVAYPANLATTIAVGASDSGDLSGDSGELLTNQQRRNREKRSWYTQYGPSLDFLVPSENQHLAITTTDRSGVGEGYNFGANGNDFADAAYTNTFGGTSAATPIAAGAAAVVMAIDSNLSAAQIRGILNNSADKIGGVAYDNAGNGRNDFYGYGRLNMLKASQAAAGIATTDPVGTCNAEAFTYSLAVDRVLASFEPGLFCPAVGPTPQSEFCFPLKAANGSVALICL